MDKGRTDYDSYALSGKERLVCAGKALLVTGSFSYLFYRSWFGFLTLPIVLAVLWKREVKSRTALRKQRLSVQFKDAILMVTAGIQSGSSVENAFLETEQEIMSLYGVQSEMGQELAAIRKGLTNRVPLEKMLLDLGRRSGVEEIRDFTEVFAAAKRIGGNMKEIIKRTADLTGQRMEEARRQLLHTDKKIREISESCGYSDQHYFSYCFKKFAGVSPNALRRQTAERAAEGV